MQLKVSEQIKTILVVMKTVLKKYCENKANYLENLQIVFYPNIPLQKFFLTPGSLHDTEMPFEHFFWMTPFMIRTLLSAILKKK